MAVTLRRHFVAACTQCGGTQSTGIRGSLACISLGVLHSWLNQTVMVIAGHKSRASSFTEGISRSAMKPLCTQEAPRLWQFEQGLCCGGGKEAGGCRLRKVPHAISANPAVAMATLLDTASCCAWHVSGSWPGVRDQALAALQQVPLPRVGVRGSPTCSTALPAPLPVPLPAPCCTKLLSVNLETADTFFLLFTVLTSSQHNCGPNSH